MTKNRKKGDNSPSPKNSLASLTPSPQTPLTSKSILDIFSNIKRTATEITEEGYPVLNNQDLSNYIGIIMDFCKLNAEETSEKLKTMESEHLNLRTANVELREAQQQAHCLVNSLQEKLSTAEKVIDELRGNINSLENEIGKQKKSQQSTKTKKILNEAREKIILQTKEQIQSDTEDCKTTLTKSIPSLKSIDFEAKWLSKSESKTKTALIQTTSRDKIKGIKNLAQSEQWGKNMKISTKTYIPKEMKQQETAIKEFADNLKNQKVIQKYDIKLGRHELFLTVKYMDQDGNYRWTSTSEEANNFKLSLNSFEDKIPIREKRKHEQTPKKDDGNKKPALDDMEHDFRG